MLLSQNGRQYINILFDRIIHNGPFMGLVELYRVIPLSNFLFIIKKNHHYY